MGEVPVWWYQVTGGAAIVVLLLCLVMIVVGLFLIALLIEVKKGISAVSERVQSIANRVESVSKQVEQVTTEVGARASGVARTVDDIAGSAFATVERYAPLVLGVAAVLKLASMFKNRGR